MNLALDVAGFDVGPGRLLLGAFTGATYGLLAVGLVLAYRASRFINFAHGAVGAFGAAIVGVTCRQLGLPYWVALPVGVLAGAVVAGGIEAVLIRRLGRRSRLTAMIVTLGLAQFLVAAGLLIDPQSTSGYTFPQPTGLPTFSVGGVQFSSAHTAMIVLTPLLLLALAVFLRRHRYGLAIRAAADSADLTALAGARPARMTMLAWAIAGGVAAFSAILVAPTQGVQTIETLGPALLLRGLAAGVIARMRSVPIAFGAGIGLGMIEQVLRSRSDATGLTEVGLGVLLVIALLVQPRLVDRVTEAAPTDAAMPLNAPRWTLGAGLLAGAAAIAAVMGLADNATALVAVAVMGATLVGLSVVVVSGLAGQLSLGQFAFAGLAAATSAHLTHLSGNSSVGAVAGVAVAAGAATLIALPAIRLHGLALAVSTLGLALAASAFLFRQPWLLGDGINPGRPSFFGWELSSTRAYVGFAGGMLAVGMIATANLRRAGFGRLLTALRDNTAAARALGVPAPTRMLQGYAIAGGLAGLGGVVIGHAQSWLTVESFPASAGIDVVAMAVIGGAATLTGPLIGALYLVGLPGLLHPGILGTALLAAGWLAIVILLPQGIVGALTRLWHRFTSRPSASLPPSATTVTGALVLPPAHRSPRSGPLLEVRGVGRRYGGVVALDEVSVTVHSGEIMGIVGPNGAGKTTLFEIIAGSVRPDAGTVAFDGTDITAASPQRRARLGVGRSFQDCRLFPTLTVRDTLAVAAESRHPTRLATAALGWLDSERARLARADEVLAALDLTGLADRRVGTLSTGTRRLVEIGALLVTRPVLLLLDEPSAGLGPAERAPLAALLQQIHSTMDTTLVVIEHDMQFLTHLATRMIALDLGQVIATGTPAEVLGHAEVQRSYFGTTTDPVPRARSVTPLNPSEIS